MSPLSPPNLGPVAASPPAGAGLIVDRINKAYNGRSVVKNVSLSVAHGEVVGLLGPNGAGKTTCFYMITGLIAADSGAITLDGRDITDLPMCERARAGLGYLPQETSIFRGLTVEQNIAAIVEMREPDRHKVGEIVEGLLAALQIERLRKLPAADLSGGELRQVEIARAMAVEPSIMLLDEPFAAVDPITFATLRGAITYLKGRGLGILVTDHNVHETLEIVDRAFILHAGETLFEGPPDAVISNPEVRRLYLGDSFK